VSLTARPSSDTVTVTDAAHPLYGLTFPLVGMTVKQRLGRVCVVWLYPGVERVIPVAATSLASTRVTPPRCRLSVAGIRALLAVIASLTSTGQEEAYATLDASPTAATSPPPIATPAPPAGGTCPPALAARSGDAPVQPDLVHTGSVAPGAGTPGARAGRAGGPRP